MEQANVRNAARVMETKKSEPMVLRVVGALLLGLAGFFVWQELHLATEVIVVIGAAAAAGLAAFAAYNRLTLVGPLALGAATGIAGAWYGATKEPVLLIAMGVAFLASAVLAIVLAQGERLETVTDKMHRMVTWIGLGASGVITTFAAYFQIFDASESTGLQDFVARRAILSLFWLLSGTALVLIGRQRDATEIRDAGFLVLAASVAKLMFYDTTHLDGAIRIGALAVGGVVLVAASFISRRLNGPVAS